MAVRCGDGAPAESTRATTLRKQRVVEGYGILQPRVAVSLPGTTRSRYARLYGSEPGIDPYTRAVSDVYQDLFHEGSFIGKGIYDVDAFEQALAGRFPENRILSHDLLEGCYARAGLLSDVQVYEEYPARYSADVSRRHRWIRGDWQILRWALASVPGTRRALPTQPALHTLAVEDLRQPSPQSHPGGLHAAVDPGMDGAAQRMVLDDGGGCDRPASFFLYLRPRCTAQTQRPPTRSTPRSSRARCRQALRPGGIHARVPAL